MEIFYTFLVTLTSAHFNLSLLFRVVRRIKSQAEKFPEPQLASLVKFWLAEPDPEPKTKIHEPELRLALPNFTAASLGELAQHCMAGDLSRFLSIIGSVYKMKFL